MAAGAQAGTQVDDESISVARGTHASNMAVLEPAAAEPPWPSAPQASFRDWERFASYPTYLAAAIVAGRLETEGVPAVIETVPPFPDVGTSVLWVPAKLAHRARWVLAWLPISE